MNTRRAVMKLIGVTPMAAGAAKANIAAMMDTAPAMTVGQANAVGTGAAQTLGNYAKHPQHVYDLERQMQQEHHERERFRLASGGIDPDIASMRSLSASYKAHKQIARNIEDVSVMEKFRRFIWG